MIHLQSLSRFFKRISLLVLALFVVGIATAQTTEMERLAADYAQRIQAAKTPEEKMKLVQELQEALKVKDFTKEANEMSQNQPKNAAQLGQSGLCKSYKATISFSTSNTRTQNCSTCGSPCPISYYSQTNGQGMFEVVANLCTVMGQYTMGAVDDFITSWSGSGSSSYNSRSKVCGPEGHSSGNFSYGTRFKPVFNFDFNTNETWSANFSIDGSGQQNNEGTTTTEISTIGFIADNTNGTCVREGEKFTLQGTFPVDLSIPDQKIVDKSSVTYRVTLVPFEESKLAAVLEPLDEASYKKWRPQGVVPKSIKWKAENDSIIGFRIRIIDKGDHDKDVTAEHPFQAEYRLSERTKYTGICGNYPFASDADTKYDLQWDSVKVKQTRSSFSVFNEDALTTLNNNGGGVVVYLRSKDFAAYAKLKADVTLVENGGVLHATCPAFSNRDHLTIPFDDNDNLMADDWERQENILSLNWKPEIDQDKFPENGNLGDDIITLDEYRGFLVEKEMVKSFVRFSPNKKELVVAAEDERKNETGQGALNFGKISGITVYTMHAFTDLNMRSVESGQKSKFNRWINFNNTRPHQSYCIVVTINDIMEHDSEASTNNLSGVPDGNGAFYPKDVDFITVRLPRVTSTAILEKAQWFDPLHAPVKQDDVKHLTHANTAFGYHLDAATMSKTIWDNATTLTHRFILFTITHELGHATHIPHHNAHVDTNVDDYAYYKGDIHCPMRYWFTDGDKLCGTNYDWMLSFLGMAWDPTTLKLPDGQPYQFCGSQDDCWHKFALCPPQK